MCYCVLYICKCECTFLWDIVRMLHLNNSNSAAFPDRGQLAPAAEMFCPSSEHPTSLPFPPPQPAADKNILPQKFTSLKLLNYVIRPPALHRNLYCWDFY